MLNRCHNGVINAFDHYELSPGARWDSFLHREYASAEYIMTKLLPDRTGCRFGAYSRSHPSYLFHEPEDALALSDIPEWLDGLEVLSHFIRMDQIAAAEAGEADETTNTSGDRSQNCPRAAAFCYFIMRARARVL